MNSVAAVYTNPSSSNTSEFNSKSATIAQESNNTDIECKSLGYEASIKPCTTGTHPVAMYVRMLKLAMASQLINV